MILTAFASGFSRSAAVVGAYLLAIRIANTAEEAVAMMRRARPALIVRPEAHGALCREQIRTGQGIPDRVKTDRSNRRNALPIGSTPSSPG